MKKILGITFLYLYSLLAVCQTLTPRVICSGYGSGQGGGIKLNYTIGETFVTTLRSGNTVLTQGFHQPEIVLCPTAPLVAVEPVNITVNCDAYIPQYNPGFYMENGTAVTSQLTTTEAFDGCTRTFTETWVGINTCGDSTVVERIVTQTDLTAPIFSFAFSEFTAECNDAVIQWPNVLATDNCTSPDFTYSESIIPGDCINNYDIERTYFASDACGNTTTQVITAHVRDTTAPVFTRLPDAGELSCLGQINYYLFEAVDNCSSVTLSISTDETEIPGGYSVVTTCQALDECGNSTFASVTNTAPLGFPGSPCDDGLICTTNDIVDENCGCSGSLIDVNNNDICDYVEPLSITATSLTFCPGEEITLSVSQPISGINYIWSNNLMGSVIQVSPTESTSYSVAALIDGQNVFASIDLVALPINVFYADSDGDGYGNLLDTLSSCQEAINGYVLNSLDCSDINADIFPNAACDDGNPCTVNDIIQSDCTCTGVFADSDQDGTCDANDLCWGPEPGTACDDNDPCTVNDLIQSDCTCAGTFADADFDGTCDANDLCSGGPEPGSGCDDRDDCTVDDMIQADCSCAGVYIDSDADGTCDAFDLCADGPEPGMACNDDNPCTINDTVDANCICKGSPTEPATSVTTVHACQPYTWNGQTYSTSGNYSFTTQSAAGCDSIAQLVLTIGTPTFTSQQVTQCGSYTWNGTTYSQSGTYTYVTTNSSGCPNTATLNLTIQTASTAPTGALASQTSVSANASVTLTVQGGSLGTGASWKWYKQACGGTLVGTGAVISTSVNATTTYFVRAEGTCNTTTCASVTVTVQTTQCGPTGASASSTSICAGASTTLSVQGTLGTGASWKWYKNGCGSGTVAGTGATLTVSPTATTTYFVRSEGGSCGITTCRSVTITVNTTPAIPQGIILPAQLCRNAPAVLSILNPIAGISYFWQVPSGWTITGGQGTSVLNVLVGQGNGQIKVYAFNSCGNSKNFVRSVSTISCSQGFATETHDMRLELWPNPTSDRVFMAHGDAIPTHMQIYDMLGRDIYNGPWVPEYDVSGLAGGIYFVRATGGGESMVKRLEVVR